MQLPNEYDTTTAIVDEGPERTEEDRWNTLADQEEQLALYGDDDAFPETWDAPAEIDWSEVEEGKPWPAHH